MKLMATPACCSTPVYALMTLPKVLSPQAHQKAILNIQANITGRRAPNPLDQTLTAWPMLVSSRYGRPEAIIANSRCCSARGLLAPACVVGTEQMGYMRRVQKAEAAGWFRGAPASFECHILHRSESLENFRDGSSHARLTCWWHY